MPVFYESLDHKIVSLKEGQLFNCYLPKPYDKLTGYGKLLSLTSCIAFVYPYFPAFNNNYSILSWPGREQFIHLTIIHPPLIDRGLCKITPPQMPYIA